MGVSIILCIVARDLFPSRRKIPRYNTLTISVSEQRYSLCKYAVVRSSRGLVDSHISWPGIGEGLEFGNRGKCS
jgi:hypothetical protein